jgi:hypothetical protein
MNIDKDIVIKFNTTSIPPNFDKWKKLDLKSELSDLNNLEKSSFHSIIIYKKDLLLLNNYGSVVIKCLNGDLIEFQLGSVVWKTENKQIYFIFFPEYQDCYLKINSSDNIEVFVPENNKELAEIDILHKLFRLNIVLFDNKKEKELILASGKFSIMLIQFQFTINNLITINPDVYYYELKQFEKKKSKVFNEITFNNIITVLDKYIQNDIIKICKQNNI